MKWNKQRLLFANEVLQLAYNDKPRYTNPGNLSMDDDDGRLIHHKIKEEIYEFLEDEVLIDIDRSPSAHPIKITKKGRDAIDKHGSFTAYLHYKEKVEAQNEKSEKINNRREKKKAHAVILQIFSSYIVIAGLVIGWIVAGWQFYEKKQLEWQMQKDQLTTTTDTIQQSTITKGH